LLLDGSNPSGTWIGQDGHDVVGPSSIVAPSGIQDIHMTIAGLPAARTITFAAIDGLGGGEWDYKGPWGVWAAAVVRSPGATTADVYAEPYQTETGRPFQVTLRYDDGSTSSFWIQGGTADPNLRMVGSQATVTWVGQDGHDYVGNGPDVGPDGIQDAHLVLSNLASGVAISRLNVDGPPGDSWAYGLNPQGLSNAQLLPRSGDPTKADLYINPDRDLNGQTLTVTIIYANGTFDSETVIAASTQPGLRMPGPPPVAPRIAGLSAHWIGQDGTALVGPGDIHVTLSGISVGRAVVAAEVSDEYGGAWDYAATPATPFHGEAYAMPLAFARASNHSPNADIAFPPFRDETGSNLTVRLVYDDGTTAVTQFTGGYADVGLRSPNPAATTVIAHPGDDLNAMGNGFGAVHLTTGTYALNQPLILNHPVSITADPGVTLLFTQPAGSKPWTAAIKINAGHTTLDGFAVRFTGPVVWDWGVSYGPAVIGTTDDRDVGQSTMKSAIVLSHLDLQSPPAASSWEQAPMLIRLVTSVGGRVENSILKGGTTEFMGGPLWILNNDYQGTVPNTFTYGAFSGHDTHDVVIEGNHVEPVGPSGKTWRFLVLTISGIGDLIQNNTVVGIGPRDNDTVPGDNAAEIILTEAYNLHFEGMPQAISSDGRILQIPPPQGGTARSGDVVAILSGPKAGQWRRIAQAIDDRTYLLDSPLPAGSYAISIATGFVGETFQGNTIDARGSTVAADLVLAGNHFGTHVVDNHFLGGDGAFKITAAPTQSPDIWGWSHAPFFGGVIDGNTIDDSVHGGDVSVEHSSYIKSDKGRVYFSGSLTNTTIGWSDAFLSAYPNPVALTIGDPGSLDPGELLLTTQGNRLRSSTPQTSGVVVINAADVNGTELLDQRQGLPASGLSAPTGLRLVDDSGLSPYDQITNDAHLTFAGVAGAAGYEYRVGSSATYSAIGSSTTFLPAGLSQGLNSIFVRAYDATGNRGPDAVLQITFDTIPPDHSPPALDPTSDTGSSNTDHVTSVKAPRFHMSAAADDTVVLLRNGLVIGWLSGPGDLHDPGVPVDGTYSYTVQRTDIAGNISLSEPTDVTIEATAPGPVTGLTVLASGQVQFRATSPTDVYQYRVGAATTYLALGTATAFTPLGMAPGANTVLVHAINSAGVVGPDASVTVFNGPASAPGGSWIGQDGHDYAGAGPVLAPDGIQDIHIALFGLRADQPVVRLEVDGLGGGQWVVNGPYGPWKGTLIQAGGSTTADLYLDPYQPETGRPFWVVVGYGDGTSVGFWVNGGVASPNLHMPAGVAAPGHVRRPVTGARRDPKPARPHRSPAKVAVPKRSKAPSPGQHR
jgi:hypothetical protein